MIDFSNLKPRAIPPNEIAVFAWAGSGPVILLAASDQIEIYIADYVIPSDGFCEREFEEPPGPGVWMWSGRIESTAPAAFDGDQDVWVTGSWRALTRDELELLADGDRVGLLVEAGYPEDAIEVPVHGDVCTCAGHEQPTRRLSRLPELRRPVQCLRLHQAEHRARKMRRDGPLVMVDEFQLWGGRQRRPFHRGSSHLSVNGLSDAHLDALHELAAKIGLHREWFQEHPRHPHYDLTERMRERALVNGAVFVPSMEQARARLDVIKN